MDGIPVIYKQTERYAGYDEDYGEFSGTEETYSIDKDKLIAMRTIDDSNFSYHIEQITLIK
jgi:hypothetical protein